MFKDEILQFSNVKSKIYFSLINYDRNKDILQEIPHRKFLDLAVTYKVLGKVGMRGILSANVNNSLLEVWNTTEEELYNLAKENTPKLFNFMSCNIIDVIKESEDIIEDLYEGEVPDFLPDENIMIAATNELNHLGSHVLLYQDYLRKILRENNVTKAYILPSSIHEIILLLDELGKKPVNVFNLIGIVSEVNKNVVNEREFLSDSVYEISLTDDISISPSSEMWKR